MAAPAADTAVSLALAGPSVAGAGFAEDRPAPPAAAPAEEFVEASATAGAEAAGADCAEHGQKGTARTIVEQTKKNKNERRTGAAL